MKTVDLQYLINEAKRGKQSAQTHIIELYWDTIYHFVFYKIKNGADAEDITIQTFTKVFSKLKLYNEDFDFLTWIRAIAHNTMIDYIRKKPNSNLSLDDMLHPIQIPDNVPTPEQNLINSQDHKEIQKIIDELPTIYKKVVELRFIEDKTYKDIAQELDLSMSNVKVRILRARKLIEQKWSR